MELKWIEDFLSLARTNNFSRSAEERNVTQSAFSRRIKALEAWLGVPLVDRSHYPTKLTRAGEVFRDAAEHTLRAIFEVRDELRGSARSSLDLITFSAIHTLSLTFFPKWLKEVELRLGSISSRFHSDNIHNCVRALVEGNSDFLLCYTNPNIPILMDPVVYSFRVLGTDWLVPVAAPTKDKTPRFKLPGTSQAPLPYLVHGPESFLGRAVHQRLSRRGVTVHLQQCYENAMAEALKTMAIEGHGLAWLPKSSIERELRRKTLVPAGGRTWDIPLEIRIYRGAQKSRPKVEEVWDFVCGESGRAENAR
jgi:DNA-binding transcriptional LysR family regulator